MTAAPASCALLEELVQFALTAQPRCFENWPETLVRQYLGVQAAAGNLAFVRTFGRISGLGIVWRTRESDLRRADELLEHAWDHGPNRPDGDSLYFAEFIAREPGVLQTLLQRFYERREWRRLKWFCHRDGELVRLDASRYERRFLTKGY